MLKKMWQNQPATLSVENSINFCLGQYGGEGSGRYIPTSVKKGHTRFVEEKVFTPAGVPKDADALSFNTGWECGHEVVFRTIALVELHKSANIDRITERLDRYFANTGPGHEKSIIEEMRFAATLMQLLSETASRLMQADPDAATAATATTIGGAGGGVAPLSLLQKLGKKKTVDLLAASIATSPRMWSLFFLSKFNNMTLLTSILTDRTFLDRLNMLFWFEQPAPQGAGNTLTPAQALAAEAEYRLPAKIFSLKHSQALIHHFHQKAMMDIPRYNTNTLTDLIKHANANQQTTNSNLQH